jgi:hypothetical protein
MTTPLLARRLARKCIPTCILVAAVTFGAAAQTCSPPAGFADTPHPEFIPQDQLASHTEHTIVNRPLPDVVHATGKVKIKDAIQHPNSLPGVGGEAPLNDIPFGTPGARRLVCLTDGTALEEQVLEHFESPSIYHFRYAVWNYSTPKAKPILYGIGDFLDTPIDTTHTQILWTYSFALKRNVFPGSLGAFGRWLFRIEFLDRDYAQLMRATLSGSKSDAEN